MKTFSFSLLSMLLLAACSGGSDPQPVQRSDQAVESAPPGCASDPTTGSSTPAPPPPPSTETCGDAPTNALCAPCPGGAKDYKQVDGKPTCTCCDSSG